MSQELKSSSERIGQLYPILVDYYGNIIDGDHRFGVDAKWRRIRLEHIGIENGRITYKIAEKTGMSYQWVMKYLPDRFKDCLQSERAKPALRRGAGMSKLPDTPKDMLSIKTYGNTDLVNIMVKKPLYKQLEKKAKKLGITPENLIYNAILLILKT